MCRHPRGGGRPWGGNQGGTAGFVFHTPVLVNGKGRRFYFAAALKIILNRPKGSARKGSGQCAPQHFAGRAGRGFRLLFGQPDCKGRGSGMASRTRLFHAENTRRWRRRQRSAIHTPNDR